MDARRGGPWLTAALLLGGCASASGDPDPTWPQWHVEPAPAAAVAHAPRPADAVHGLPDGTLGLRPAGALPGSADVLPGDGLDAGDPWAALPVHGRVFHYLAHVYEAPRADARAIGYMRRGTLLRAGEEVGRDGCAEGWYPVWGGGYVCRGQGYRLGAQPLEREADHPPPNLTDPLPYRYVKVVAATLQTWRLPTPEEDGALRELLRAELAARAEQAALAGSQAETGAPGAAQNAPDADVADAGAPAETSEQTPSRLPSWVRMVDDPGHYLSVATEVRREDGRLYLQTVRGAFVPAEATVPVQAPELSGRVLREALPVALAEREAARVAPALDGTWRKLPPLPRGEVLSLTGEARTVEGRRYLAANDGSYVQAARIKRIESHPRPALVPRGARWVHVDAENQTLTAYEGDRAVYVTLVSTGKAGFETPEGLHRIHAKHVTATMDDTALSDGAYYIEDVPWTMFFQGGYALHAAFWHDRFGRSRSHGCVNLAPRDAHWLFEFLTPAVPGGRHGVLVPGERPSYVLVESGGAAESS